MGRGSDSRESDHLRLLGLSAREAAHHQWFGAHQPGTQTPHPPARASSPIPSSACALGLCLPNSTTSQTTRSISTSTRNSGVIDTCHEKFTEKGLHNRLSQAIPTPVRQDRNGTSIDIMPNITACLSRSDPSTAPQCRRQFLDKIRSKQ
jgi:hypothetical protein